MWTTCCRYGEICCLVLAWMAVPAGADNLTIYTDRTIDAGETYGTVTVRSIDPENAHLFSPLVEFYGEATALETYDYSIVDLYGPIGMGETSTIMGFSTVNMYEGAEFWGGSGSLLTVGEHATLNIYAGKISSFFGAHDSSTVNLYGGVLVGFGLSDQAVLNVFGGEIYTDGFWWENTVASTATVNIYGSGFEFDPEGDWWEEICLPEEPDCGGHWISKLAGYDLDGDPVTYWGLPDPATHPNIQIIPEPATLLLFLSGTTLMAVMRRRHP